MVTRADSSPYPYCSIVPVALAVPVGSADGAAAWPAPVAAALALLDG